MALTTVVVLLLSVVIIISLSGGRRNYPPGPKGLPVIGAAKEHPKTEFWKTYAEWGRKYGNLGFISFHILGRRMVVLNSVTAAEDLLSRRSVIYSDRPFPPMAGQLMKREKSMFYISYNERLKTYRKFMHQGFNPSASQNYWGISQNQARILVANIYKSPQNLMEHLRRNAAAVTMKIAYGYTIDQDKDHFVALAEESMRVASLAGAPGKWLVDSIPALKYLPEWFPGAGFKRQARAWCDQLYTQSLEPHDFVKQQMAAGTAEPSFTSRLLETVDESVTPAEHEDLVLWTAGAIYAAGADTTVSAVKTFYFLMMLHPEVQKRAQAEVDSIVAKERRLPTVQDRASMPYMDAVVQEVLRWHPPSPFGLFHCTAADDEYNGYSIPAKTTVIANIWAMAHDAEQYPDPFTFNPDRFVKKDGSDVQRDPREIVFGFGRRICPGQHMAEASIFIQMATTLSVLDISKQVDKDGETIEPEIAFTTAIVSHIKPFQCTIKPRSKEAVALLLQDIASVA
ncbi:cytochrome P450 [Crassisporium funariophilum]|nr:cytochrome P450 [Crassisporium funariophilum]